MDQPVNDQSHIDPTAQRLDQLERENRRLKRRVDVMALLGAVILVGVLSRLVAYAHSAGAPRVINAKVVNAEWFSLRDEEGRARAKLTVDPGGVPILAFYDKLDKSKMSISINKKDEPCVYFFNDGGENTLRMGQSESIGPWIGLHDSQGKSRMLIVLGPDGTPYLALRDANGVDIARLMPKPDKTISLAFPDNKLGVNRLEVGVGKDGSPFITAYNKAFVKKDLIEK